MKETERVCVLVRMKRERERERVCVFVCVCFSTKVKDLLFLCFVSNRLA